MDTFSFRLGVVCVFLWFSFFTVSLYGGEPELRFWAGMSAQEVDLPQGTPLGGYGGDKRRLNPPDFFNQYPYATYFKPAVGKRDPIQSKALVFQSESFGKRKPFLFLSLDVVGATGDLYEEIVDLARPYGIQKENIFVSATHTHSGPGAISKQQIWQMITMDDFHSEVYSKFLEGIRLSIDLAYRNLEEVNLFRAKFKTEGLQKNRRGKPGHFDPEAFLLLLQSKQGCWTGGLAHFAIHGTGFSGNNLNFSSDVSGSIERYLGSQLAEMNLGVGNSLLSQCSKRPVPVMHINGAEGDVTPSLKNDDGVEEIGARFADQATLPIRNAVPIEVHHENEVQSIRKDIHLGKARVTLSYCMDTSGPWGKSLGKIALKIGHLMKGKTQVSAMRIGDLVLMTWPGEPTTDLGIHLKNIAFELGAQDALVMGLTNDYKSYFTTQSERGEGGYEVCATLFKEGEKRIFEAHRLLLKDLF